MSRQHYLDLAEKGLAMPLAVDLFVHRLSSPEKVEQDAAEMARVMAEAAGALATPLAVAPMDLRVEKAAVGELLGIAPEKWEAFHLEDPLDPEQFDAIIGKIRGGFITQRMRVTIDALAAVSQRPGLVSVGMCIGPFSLVTKLMTDVITAFYLMGQELEPDDDEAVELADQLLRLSTELVVSYARAQVQAGANAVIVCEPAANKVYVSPNQMEDGSDIFERAVMVPNRRLRDGIEQAGGDLILHDCGELTDEMIRLLGTLRPVMLSLGSSVDLPSAAPLLPKDVVLFGNIPSKFFPRDGDMPLEKVEALCGDLHDRMKATGHPFILGSECDVLCVHGHEETIQRKTECISRRSTMTAHP